MLFAYKCTQMLFAYMVATPMGMDPPYPGKSLSYTASSQRWATIDPICLLGKDTGTEVIIFSVLNSTEHEISTAHKN